MQGGRGSAAIVDLDHGVKISRTKCGSRLKVQRCHRSTAFDLAASSLGCREESLMLCPLLAGCVCYEPAKSLESLSCVSTDSQPATFARYSHQAAAMVRHVSRA